MATRLFITLPSDQVNSVRISSCVIVENLVNTDLHTELEAVTLEPGESIDRLVGHNMCLVMRQIVPPEPAPVPVPAPAPATD